MENSNHDMKKQNEQGIRADVCYSGVLISDQPSLDQGFE